MRPVYKNVVPNVCTDGQEVGQAERRAQVLEVGDLLIAAVRSSDAGQYTCVRANEAGRVEQSAWLVVLGKLKNY